MATGLSAEAPCFSHYHARGLRATRSGVSKNLKDVAGMIVDKSSEWKGNFMFMIELRKMILTFRDTIDLPPCDSSSPINELVMGTVADLQNLYPNVVPGDLNSGMRGTSTKQGLACLYTALRSIGDSWAKNHKWITNCRDESDGLEQLGGRVLAKLKYMTNIAKKMFDVMEVDENDHGGRLQGSTIGGMLGRSYSGSETTCLSPDTPTSVPPELSFATGLGGLADVSGARPILFPLRLRAVGSLMPTDMKCLSFNIYPNMSSQGSSQNREMKEIAEESAEKVSLERPNDSKAPKSSSKIPNFSSDIVPKARHLEKVSPPKPLLNSTPTILTTSPFPPSYPFSKLAAAPLPPIGSARRPPPPMPLTKGAAPPPPPPLGVAKALRPKKASTKLKRSTHMGHLYRALKGKVEGSSLYDKVGNRSRTKTRVSPSGQQGMADALAEMTKRSAYFQQIEEDVQKHAKSIMAIKAAIDAFQTKDMTELVKFHKYVEQHLEQLTDETQVLARFEGFPTKKLESLRTATALYLKLEGIVTTLRNWKVMPPFNQLLDKVDSYFNKIKGEIDALERTKDEEYMQLQSQNIHFDFSIIVRIKEAMVDLSSNCMELALKERQEAKSAAIAETGSKTEDQAMAHVKMLWRAFQLAYRVYSFAGGQDERADMLTLQLANEIEADPRHE